MTGRRKGSAREAVLGAVRSALADRTGAAEDAIPRDYATSRSTPDVVGLFRERVADYQATVESVPPDNVRDAVATALRAANARRVVLPAGLPENWVMEGDFDVLTDSPALDAAELDAVDAVVTTATAGIASTGTIVLDHGRGQGRRALTLVPDAHVCVVEESQVADDVPAALARLDPTRPLTFISGPSATSDIELDRVEGVHGPRTLHVLVVRGE